MAPDGWKEISLGDVIKDSAFGPRFSSNLCFKGIWKNVNLSSLANITMGSSPKSES